MSFQQPQSKCTIHIDGLGKLDGLEYASGVQQYCGIPYARLLKRWTRSSLNTNWECQYHDGTKLGNDCPMPGFEDGDADDLVPVPSAPHFPDKPKQDELTGLVMNIVIPSKPGLQQRSPVLAYVHGGSLLYGGANLPIFDAVNLVSHSVAIGLPIVCVTFNYRVGLGGFLAGRAIAEELQQDGYQGSGNFGFTDQQVAFEWIQSYIAQLGGDPGSVTAVGESAGGISISNQMMASNPLKCHRVVCMSGQALSIPPWTIEQHDELFGSVCRHFSIDPTSPDALDLLRELPQDSIANATPAIQGVASGTGNPCLDGWFYAHDPLAIQEAPEWVESYMLGDTYHEGVIFHLNLLDYDFSSIRRILLKHIESEDDTDTILDAYNISACLSHESLVERVEHMCGDAIFKIPNYATAMQNKRLLESAQLFTYHFDQLCRLEENVFYGTAYHAHELLYLFMNLTDRMNEEEVRMAKSFATAWIKFVHGRQPWSENPSWKVWGPDSLEAVRTVDDDELIRGYKRMNRMLDMGKTWKKWLLGIDELVNKRWNMASRRSSIGVHINGHS